MAEPERGWEFGRGKGRDVRFPGWWRSKPAREPGDAPEVLIRFTGTTKTPDSLRASLQYFTRTRAADAARGQEPLTAELNTGRSVTGNRAVQAVATNWIQGNALYPTKPTGIDRKRAPNESLSLVLSLPGHQADAVIQDAARAWARRNLAGHEWLMVQHRDTDNSHIHIAVRAVGKGGRRFGGITIAEKHRWREEFAQELRQRGVKAQATERESRLQQKVEEQERGRGLGIA